MFPEVDLTGGRPKGPQRDQTRASEIVPARGGEPVYIDGRTAGQGRGGSGRSGEGFDAGRRRERVERGRESRRGRWRDISSWLTMVVSFAGSSYSVGSL